MFPFEAEQDGENHAGAEKYGEHRDGSEYEDDQDVENGMPFVGDTLNVGVNGVEQPGLSGACDCGCAECEAEL